jgi:hypothetical protein
MIPSTRLGQLTTSKGILLWCASMVGNLDATRLSYRIVVQVHIGSLIEAMMWGLLGRRGNVVVDVREAILRSVHFLLSRSQIILTASRATPHPAEEALCHCQ